MNKEFLYKVYSWITRKDKKYKQLSITEKTSISLKALEEIFPNDHTTQYINYTDPLINIWLTTPESAHLDKVSYLKNCEIIIQLSDSSRLIYRNGTNIVEMDETILTRTPKLKGGGWRKGEYSEYNQYVNRDLLYKVIKDIPEEGVDLKDLSVYYDIYREIPYNKGKYLKLVLTN